MPTLSLEAEFTRSHGSLYKALLKGRIDEERLRRLLVAHRPSDWPQAFAVDASTWERCDAECSPERGFYYSASWHSAGQPIVAGWSFQWICQLSFTPDSWTAPSDVAHISPLEDTTTATINQYTRPVAGLVSRGVSFPHRGLGCSRDYTVALARLLNTGELRRSVPTLSDEYRTIPSLTGAGWYPLPTKAGRLPNGDAPFKCYWDGARWTDRCRVWLNGRFQDVTTRRTSLQPTRCATDGRVPARLRSAGTLP